MITNSNEKWIQKWSVDETEVAKIAVELNVSPLFIEVCFQRGLKTIEQIESFLTIDETWFHDPFLMHDMKRGIERIVEAIESNEKITIYGDYDADGITSTTLLYETLDSIGAQTAYYLPNRFIEGYGPDIDAFEEIIQAGTSLIITVDNGVTGHDAIKYAQSQGIDVIVTDHHKIPEVLPDAYAIIHPAHPDGEYPFADLAGVGVALKVATALLGELPAESLDLAAIGTVADLVSLTDENRAIVFFGLNMIQHSQRTGLLQLLQVIDINPQEVNEETIGFQIAPRLNATGRLGDASPAVDLLVTHEITQAKELAEFVDIQNVKRKEMVEMMTEDVLDRLKLVNQESEVVVLGDKNWHQGILGIVASRIVEKTNKPTLLFTIDPETNIAKGSARSIEGIDLYEAFKMIDDLFIQYGGHAMAAGMSALSNDLDEIQNKLSEYIVEIEPLTREYPVDAFSKLKELSIETIKDLNKLRPFGMGNERPLIVYPDVNVVESRKVGAEGDHLKLSVNQSKQQLDVISFRNGSLADYLFEDQRISIAGYVEINEWNGISKPQMQMIDIEIPGPMLVDKRLNKLTKQDFQEDDVNYLFYNKDTYKEVERFIPDSAHAVLLTSLDQAKAFESQNKIIIVDCPNSITLFHETIEGNIDRPIDCYFYQENHLYLTGLPTRTDFSKVYKFLLTQESVDLKKNGHHMINYLKMETDKIYLIVKVFLEAKFVIIENGLLEIVNNPDTIKLEETKSYRSAVEQFKAEELFLYSSFKEIIETLK